MSTAASPRVDRLPAEWVARVLSKLAVRYGAPFKARYAGIEERLVAEDWAEQLAQFARRPDCIAYALENLPPDRIPNAAQFRELCNAMPAEREAFKALPSPRTPIPADVLRAIDRIKEPAEVEGQYAGPKGWAYRLRDREAQGAKLSLFQRRAWRDVVGAQP